eukprot:CAMPEP_0185281682 /NCGR_PEP_ID=MMETSP1359-20130426/66854_1 /TAXON_ID=552665 /ORGANISM="Bigelowiella longifila, Strain CCMP242" /LENGTH=191 /DNA_ID=CAMNT_0027877141 /DNA_START=119 /DNA_END=694 /DNA_ORIENTATION=+
MKKLKKLFIMDLQKDLLCVTVPQDAQLIKAELKRICDKATESWKRRIESELSHRKWILFEDIMAEEMQSKELHNARARAKEINYHEKNTRCKLENLRDLASQLGSQCTKCEKDISEKKGQIESEMKILRAGEIKLKNSRKGKIGVCGHVLDTVMQCGHQACESCATAWLSNRKKCPVCKVRVRKKVKLYQS